MNGGNNMKRIYEKIREYFTYTNVKITFKKAERDISGYGLRLSYKLITDDGIIQIINELQKTYGFKIKRINIGDNYNESKIVIRCKKDDKFSIFTEFSDSLNGYINETHIH